MVYLGSMRNLKTLLFLFSLGLIPASTLAADFNPNNILTDAELQDYNSLGKSEIRAFLENRNSALTDLIVPDYEGKNRYVSDIIYKASQEYQINPKYLLVKLQKEQSLITSKNPTERQLNWATGYGACDSCDTTDPRLTKYMGFGKQVDGAAGIMRWYYDNVSTQNWIKRAGQTLQIDNQTVVPENNATAFLYTYTPHLHGNANFAKLWSAWFASSYPDGTLLKNSSSPLIYALINGQKRPIKSLSVLNSRFNIKLLVTTSDAELDKYPTGPALAFRNFSILRIGAQYYLLDYDTARPFADSDLVRKLGYDEDEITTALPMDLEGYTIGDPINLASINVTGRLVKVGSSLYYLKDNGYYSLSDPAIAEARFPGVKATTMKPEEFATLNPLGALLFPDATLVGSKLTKSVYVIEKGKKRLIPTETAFLGLGYQWKNVLWADDLTLEQHPTGEAVNFDPGDVSTSTVKLTGSLELSTAKITFTKNLNPGANNSEVLALQNLLYRLGYLTDKPNGNYGPATTAAVKKFQTANKLSAVGYVGTNTRAALNKIANQAATTPVSVAPKYEYINLAAASPLNFKEVGRMYATPTTSVSYIGPTFTTDLDSYLVARVNGSSSEIVAGKNIDTPRPLASLTKVLTGAVLFKDNLNLDLATSYDSAKHRAPADGNPFPVVEGDVLYNKDILTGLLASSFNQAAMMLVDAVGYTPAEFVNQMNTEVANLGLTRTKFYDPHGYNQNNQSTAREYEKIFLSAVQNPTLKQYLAIPSYSYDEISSVDKQITHSDYNSNRLLLSDLPYTIEATKTGFLNESGFNLAMLIRRPSDGAEFFVLTLGNPDYAKKYSEPDRLAKWALANF